MSMPSSAADTIRQNAKFRPPAVHQVRVGGFFGPRIETIATATAHTLLDRCIEAGMLDQVDPDRPNPGLRIPYQQGNDTVSTQMFWDSDFGKSIEAAAYGLLHKPDAALEARIDEIVDAYGRLQDENGYLNSWYQRIEPGKRWTNLRDCHELYDAGHLMEGAVAYYHVTGKRKLLDIMARYADHIATVFGPGKDQKPGYCGHPEIELALVKLGRATGEQRYLELARFFVNERGQRPDGEHYYDREARARGRDPADYHFATYEYSQSHVPVREQRHVVGHAVRAAYLYSGMADVSTEFGDDSLKPALEAIWAHLTEKNLYVTGGFGPSAHNEGLTFDYDLPNETAYAETCAAVALVFWASRMLGLGPDRAYADVMERALYNGALVGLSIDGTRFFYDNPLESRGKHHRWTWHRCPCCPPNIARLVASVGTYMYGESENEIAVHLYCEGIADLETAGTAVRIRQETIYPLDGAIRLTLEPQQPAEFTLSLRLPAWSPGVTIRVNAAPVDRAAVEQKGYARLSRLWKSGDVVELDLEMPVQQLYAHPKAGVDQGRVALQRGPLVYCLEGVDNGDNLNSLVLQPKSRFRCEPVNALGGIPALVTTGLREVAAGESLYTERPPRRKEAEIRAVPYHLWDNRAAGEMLVWIRTEGGR
ncbi:MULTISPECIES: glycoside hydrolase family 127 protein [unclassified Rhizobium]|uniref:glycoside hydrolase family 127 protein n=1 Tax=unclassified Rhizobium TaxID=2613769 RepID=UPI001AD95475|nr:MULTISPECIES: beta-L-arabinofuranosidase domain-containing protein [unclassified Rhizobium]MBO9097672.1 glycoside hydrolase family 127 protein [Rhizobium sp. L58/93]MBO9133546.1 glycoside hydrolase family 127 protein [Rhizobium sp. B209b/85]MBO9167821.1 glycoside hydrolase family 127 protein [Rhizobium sp. L245/93]MBO9183866.1 glycoside hydrolase family 127 protein [Rhizobium sp. E27B/91]QXZ84111.1 glycoside hydrolase family 127 protein [Rhizobium sp. K1/93]